MTAVPLARCVGIAYLRDYEPIKVAKATNT